MGLLWLLYSLFMYTSHGIVTASVSKKNPGMYDVF